MGSFSQEEREALGMGVNSEYEKEYGNKPFGDRRNELVIIGVGMDEAEITKILDSALLTTEELENPETWKHLRDTLPQWI